MVNVEINVTIGQDKVGQVYYLFQKRVSFYPTVQKITKALVENPNSINLILKIVNPARLKVNLLNYNAIEDDSKNKKNKKSLCLKH